MAEDKTKAIQTQNVKLGERVLKDSNLELVLPNWKEVMDQVEQIRKTAIEIATDSKKDDKFDFNNVISILGERGSGKSSVLLTLRKKLMNLKYESGELYGDVFLDVIVPEMLEDSSDILGVILLNFKTYIERNREKINKHYQKVHRMRESNGDTFNSCLFKEKNQLDILWDKVFSLYIYRKKGANKVIEENFSGVSHYTEERKEALVSELELSAKLRLFFDELICALNGSNPGSHLIFICFDDVDLNPKRCNEVLNVVLKYLNYPNIVTFISGDIDKFQEDMVSELLLQHEGYRFINKKFVEQRTMLESQKELVYDFLKKIMPYSRRFSLRKLDAQAKMNFQIIDSEQSEFKTVPMMELIGRFFDENERPYEYNGKGNEFISSYFQIFDDKPRGLLNVYSFLYSNDQFSNNYLNDRKMDYEHLLAYYQKLFVMIIETNTNLRRNRKFIENLYTMTNDQIIPILLEIHHDKLRVELMDHGQKIPKTEMILIIHFLYFIESMVERNVSNISGKEYSQDLNLALSLVDNQRLIPHTTDVRNVFALYSELNRIFDIDQMSTIYDKRIYLNKYFKIINEHFGDYAERFADDSIWLEHYKYISDSDGKKMLDIKDKILEEFKEFKFDLSILDDWESRRREILKNINNDELKILIEKERYEDVRKSFEDYSLYFYFVRTINAEERRAVFKNVKNELRHLTRKLQTMHEIMMNNQFRMSVDLSQAYFKLEKNFNHQEGLDIELAIKKLKLFQKFLEDEIQFFINTRSVSNEKLLINRVNDGRVILRINNVTLSDDKGRSHYNYLKILSFSNDQLTLDYRPQDSRVINWTTVDNQFVELLSDSETKMKNENVYEMFIKEGIPGVTQTKMINAFNRYSLIHFYCFILENVDELLGNLESSQITILLYDLDEKIKADQYGENNETNILKWLEQTYRSISLHIYYAIKEFLDESNALNIIYKMRNELLAKFDALEEQYQSHEVDIHQLGKLIAKLRDETLILELKSVQRRLLTTGSVNKDSFDTLIKRMETYLNSMNADSYATIELKGLASNLCMPEERNVISMEIKRVRNEARERLYQLELELLIHAAAYVYDRQVPSKGALV
ncbi:MULTISPECIES: hypothetical protein [Bacillales]|uniref:hypothetical protein n=1 Tax=Bacillales TaxID=1385 RepID=UPI000345D2FE|nr:MULTISPECIES: hypothetical protein [Bacillales]KMZ42852.1 hypothetical protein AC624_17940 [Bacillus sp. FJAT-27238]